MKKQPNKNHFSIQIQCKSSVSYVSVLLKLESVNQKEAIQEAKNKAREIWSALAVYKPYSARIINEITSEKIKLV